MPILFYVSAVYVGLAMVIFESSTGSRVFHKPLERDVIEGLGKALPYLLSLYLMLKVGDIVARGAVETAFVMSAQSVMFWIELVVGVVLPLALLIAPEVSRSTAGVFWSALCVIVGLVINRLNVSLVGIKVESWQTYFPSWMEFALSIGIVCAGLIIFSLAVKYLPVYEHEAKAKRAKGEPAELVGAKEETA